MANAGLQLLGFTLAFLGFIGCIASTVMVEWKASSYAGDNIITAQALYEGLWKSCASQSTGQVQCKVYDSLLQLPAIVVGTRGLMLSAILLCLIALLLAAVGMKCTTCLADQPEQKNKVALTGGIILIIAGLLSLVGASWYAHRIAQDFYNPFTPTNSKYEFGSALFVGWGAAILIAIGGGFMCCNCPSKGSGKAPRYPRSNPASNSGKDYV
ncbi:claudin-1 [Syngnathoides biaculeatus]|uniref:claudin-1 n=1 Tax=Syngnathoides biaculeatus TaxID=300417 RepID=UPI002ADD9D0D|nr:claudin-1 [Syngnathoides biaculeatus]